MAINETDYKPEVLELVWQPWTIELRPYSDGGYFAKVVELHGCMTEADTATEALESLEEARAEWLAAALEQGLKIPEPVGEGDYSGKIFVRTSPELHRAVVREASRQGVSMSQWVSEVIAQELGLVHAARSRTSHWSSLDVEELRQEAIAKITESERKLFAAISEGATLSEVAKRLEIAEESVQKQVQAILEDVLKPD
jgi:antitoxin HicB